MISLWKKAFRFSTFQDILMLQKTAIQNQQGISQHNQVYYLYFQSQRIFFKGDQTVMELQQFIKKQVPDTYQVSVLQNDDVEYSLTTPLDVVVQEDMILKINQQANYVVLNRVEEPPVIDLIQDYPITQHAIQEYFADIDVPQRSRVILSKVIQKLLAEIDKNKQPSYDKNLLNLIVKKVILKLGLNAKKQKRTYRQLNCLSFNKIREIAKYQEQHYQGFREIRIDTIAQDLFLSRFFRQHSPKWGTYGVWGWDVMEPVTYMIGVSDMIIAYVFWMRTTKQYTFDNVLQISVEKHLDKRLSQVYNYQDELNDVNKMIEYLRFKGMLYSTDMADVINVIEGAIEEKTQKLIDEEEENN